MARSSYIYVVYDKGTGKPLSAFTVKHEMQTARDRTPFPTTYLVFRDNQPNVPPKRMED